MTVSAGSDQTKVGMARCAVPAAFSGGTLRAQGHESIAQGRAGSAPARRGDAAAETVSKLRTFFEQIGNQKDQI